MITLMEVRGTALKLRVLFILCALSCVCTCVYSSRGSRVEVDNSLLESVLYFHLVDSEIKFERGLVAGAFTRLTVSPDPLFPVLLSWVYCCQKEPNPCEIRCRRFSGCLEGITHSPVLF